MILFLSKIKKLQFYVSENSNEFAEMELKKILKNDPYNLKKLTAFKKNINILI